ncbi:hypothetical protein [Treponema sp. R6D11]
MNNFKWGFSAAIFALVVSVLLGLVSGVGAFHIFIRAIIFAVVFFGLGFGLNFVINSYFPELLYINEETSTPETDESEGHISIAMDSMGEYAVPELFNQGDPNELGNIEDLISGIFKPGGADTSVSEESSQPAYPNINFSMADEGIDQNRETGYNGTEDFGDVSFGEPAEAKPGSFDEAAVFDRSEAEKPQVFQPQFTPSIGDDSGLGGLPDLDMMAMAFSNYSGPPTAAASSVPSAGPTNPVEESEPDRSQYKGNKPQALKGDFNPQTLAEGIRTVLSKD